MIFDLDDGDLIMPFGHKQNMGMDMDGRLQLRMGKNMAMDMDSGELHLTTNWETDDDDDNNGLFHHS